MNNIVVLIPAYNPNQKLINLVSELKNNFSKIIIINDGSNRKSKKIFQELTNYPECTILEYSENKVIEAWIRDDEGNAVIVFMTPYD